MIIYHHHHQYYINCIFNIHIISFFELLNIFFYLTSISNCILIKICYFFLLNIIQVGFRQRATNEQLTDATIMIAQTPNNKESDSIFDLDINFICLGTIVIY